MDIKFNELPGWIFKVIELSVGVYSVSGNDNLGRNIEQKGVDPDILLEECKKYASQHLNSKRIAAE